MDAANPWKEFKIRNRIAIYGFVFGLPGITLIAILLKLWDENIAGAMFIGLLLFWVITWGWSAFRLLRWPCPRCGNPWLSSQEPYQLFNRACARCGLKLYETP